MMLFASKLSREEISPQVGGQIPFRTIDLIISKSKSHKEMLWYVNATHKNGWSRSMVLNQFELKAYERSLIEPTSTLAAKSDDLIYELQKDTYVFDFLDTNNLKTEKDLKKQMIDNIIKFLQELGPGFSLVGKEYKLKTPTDEEYFIDLLMYHTKMHTYVAIEIKIGKLKPADLGQLMFYVNALDKLEKTDRDEDSVGLIICKEADSFVAKTTLDKSNMKLWVSKYKILDELPEYLEKRLKELEI